jgi:branched-chain amino acid transport system ATP-binding protein
MATLFKCHELKADYGSFRALRGISIEIEDKQSVALFGHNGSGKSTLLNCLVGAHQELSGVVSFAGTPIVAGEVHRNVKLGIGFVPQTHNVFPELSVERNLLIAGMIRGNSELETVFDLFPILRSRRNQLAGTMSGGERQVLAFGMALMTRPRVLLLDEPTAGLAPVFANMVLDTVNRVRQAMEIGVLIVEQNVSRTLKVVDRAIILKTGRIVSDGPSEDLRDKQSLWEWF